MDIKQMIKDALAEQSGQPQTRDQAIRTNGKLDYAKMNPLNRHPSTWNDADRNYAELQMAEEAERIASKTRNKGNKSNEQELTRILMQELQKRMPVSQPAYDTNSSHTIPNDWDQSTETLFGRNNN